ncbi:MAG TPA: hypothetical protein VHO48_15295 [Anaerolineaceae bacterium]|jgi:hypothetical protein|nr:hypothetical protein [Anaerolineaceae bacterium]
MDLPHKEETEKALQESEARSHAEFERVPIGSDLVDGTRDLPPKTHKSLEMIPSCGEEVFAQLRRTELTHPRRLPQRFFRNMLVKVAQAMKPRQ